MKNTADHKPVLLMRGVCFLLVMVISVLILQGGCASPSPITHLSPAYVDGLASSARAQHADPETAARGIEAVKALFENYSTNSILEYADKVYAESLYFRDGFREMTNRTDLIKYLVHGAEPLRTCTFQFDQVMNDDYDYYLRWVMRVSLPSDPEGYFDEAVGMSHMRFNTDGQVIFHQDYWDPTDVLYRRIPMASGLIRIVKDRL